MAENTFYTVESNTKIANDVYLMGLAGPTGMFTAPGQFINLRLEGFYLRRPISVCRWEENRLDIIYKVVGGGTRAMAALAPGARLEALAGLGNGFDVAATRDKKVLLIGGGVGTPPLYGLAQALAAAGSPPAVALGFAAAGDVFFEAEFKALCCTVAIATEDGSAGHRGFVTGPMAQAEFDHYCACGPLAMLRAVYDACQSRGIPGQLSFEEKMGCGFGVCMGCSCHTKSGAKKVCADGPVFPSEEVVWE